MENKTVEIIETVIEYIENHLDGKLDLETVAGATNYSKYHLHHMFTQTVGMTIHDYVVRRQLTEAGKLLVFSNRPILEIAFSCGYESQQAFTSSFKSMYKVPPAQYRENQEFYPLQLRFVLHKRQIEKAFTKEDIVYATRNDIPEWMNLMRLAIDGYPVMNEEKYLYEMTKEINPNDTTRASAYELWMGAPNQLDGAVGMNSGIFNNPFIIWGKYRKYIGCIISNRCKKTPVEDLLFYRCF